MRLHQPGPHTDREASHRKPTYQATQSLGIGLPFLRRCQGPGCRPRRIKLGTLSSRRILQFYAGPSVRGGSCGRLLSRQFSGLGLTVAESHFDMDSLPYLEYRTRTSYVRDMSLLVDRYHHIYNVYVFLTGLPIKPVCVRDSGRKLRMKNDKMIRSIDSSTCSFAIRTLHRSGGGRAYLISTIRNLSH